MGVIRLVTVVTALSAALLLAPSAQAGAPAGAYDRAFLTDMIAHHAMAVEMGKMAEGKAGHPELKGAAEEIVESQSAEIRLMRRWLRRWYGTRRTPPHGGHDAQMGEKEMRELERATGAEFEVRFLALMSVHHTQAIEQARVARRRARHRQVRRLARAIIKVQNEEITRFRQWLVAWYAN
jgi:uncharacterized protein (DUF305 family)